MIFANEKRKMNATQAKKISIISYLKSCGFEPEKNAFGKSYYLSPFRSENGPSFKVDLNKNVWIDYGSGQGGNIIDLCMQMNRTDVKGALQLLSNMNHVSFFSHKQETIQTENESIHIKHIQHIQNKALIQYIESRKIPIEIAKLHVKEAYFTVNENPNKLFSVCFQNDKGGFELRNRLKNGKGTKSPKYYTTIKGQNHNSLNIFEGFFDFLSALTYYNIPMPNNDTIVLNSTSNLDKIIQILPNYHNINLYLDNDTTGISASQIILKQHTRTINQSEKLFAGFKDFNEFLCKT